MSTRKENWINAESLCKIIETLKSNGVAEFRYADLHIVLLPQYNYLQQISETKSEKKDSEPDLGELILSDPLAFEEAQLGDDEENDSRA